MLNPSENSPLKNDKQLRHFSRENYPFHFVDEQWVLSRDKILIFTPLRAILHQDLFFHFKHVLVYYAQNYSGGHTQNLLSRFSHFAHYIASRRGPLEKVQAVDLISYRSTLSAEHEWYLGTLRGLFKKWCKLGYDGVDEDVPFLLDGWRLKGNSKGRAVRLLCPKTGPLSPMEFEALRSALLDAWEKKKITLEEFLLVEIFMATGRRPSQIADLKIKDFTEVTSGSLQQAFLNIPRRKQKVEGWRRTFKLFAINPDLALLLKEHFVKVQAQLAALNYQAAVTHRENIAIFPHWHDLEQNRFWVEEQLTAFTNDEDRYHCPTNRLSYLLGETINSLHVLSERTGGVLSVFPTRLRRTFATRAAREGYGSLMIAELLDHTDTQNVSIYTENVPEHIDAINQAMAREMAPLAQAFAGVLVRHETEALRGDDPTSRVRSGSGGVGTCGHYGFCGAAGPIACYTCRHFQPWEDGPHQEILDNLLNERERIFTVTQDKGMAAINDRTILAVTQVVKMCEVRQGSAALGKHHG